MKNYKSWLLVITVIVGVIGFISFSCSMGDSDAVNKTAKLAYPPWVEGIAYTNVAKVVLEQEMGYSCTITQTDVANGFQGIADGDQDAFMEVWLPELHSSFVSSHGDSIIDLTAVYDGTRTGLVVPQYFYTSGPQKIDDLGLYKTELGGEIQGMNSGSGIMQKLSQEVLPGYNLETDFTLIANEGISIMLDELGTAVANTEEIVVALWRPHWAFAKWDLKFLDDPNNYFDEGSIHIYGRADLGEDKPELNKFLQNMSLTNAQLSDLLLSIANSSDTVENVAAAWVENNKTLIQSWIPLSLRK